MQTGIGWAHVREPATYDSFSYGDQGLRHAPIGELRLLVQKAIRDSVCNSSIANRVGNYTINRAGDCLTPVIGHYCGDGDGMSDIRSFSKFPRDMRAYFVTTIYRCRRCDNCRAKRAGSWAIRAGIEYDRHARCWLGTLTIRPDQQILVEYGAEREYRYGDSGKGKPKEIAPGVVVNLSKRRQCGGR